MSDDCQRLLDGLLEIRAQPDLDVMHHVRAHQLALAYRGGCAAPDGTPQGGDVVQAVPLLVWADSLPDPAAELYEGLEDWPDVETAARRTGRLT